MPSDLARFLEALRNDGRVRVGTDPPDASDRTAEDALREWDRAVRAEWPWTAPELEVDVALRTAVLMYRACQLLVYREKPAEAVQQAFAAPLARARTPSIVYSIDLTLRFLPGLHALARAASAGDPLTQALLKLGQDWPLSSVGMPECVPTSVDAILSDPGLRQVYVDRILERGDASRLSAPRVEEAVREAVGDHAALAGHLEAALGE
jgi:hypothetical protein